MYLFKNDDNKWIFGNTIHSECPAGIYRVDPNADYTKITIRSKERDVPIVKDELVTNFLKSDGTRYANFTELQSGYDGFFETSVTADVELTNADVVTAEQSDATKLNMTEASASAIKTAVEKMDDWDESDRAKVNPIVGQTGVEAGAGKPTLKTQRTLQAKPDYVDITSDTVIYEGYSNGTNYDICKIDLSTAVITREWATGTWANRASLFVV
jgi:hypothetical protein